MSEQVQVTLRKRLRDSTRGAHEALDAQVSAFDLSTRSGLRCFLAMQVQALSALASVADGAACAPIIRVLRNGARDDLATLSGRVPAPAPAPRHKPHPLALDYVISGSRLGTVVLKRRWQASTDPAVRAATAYFGAPDGIEHWRAFCASTEAIDAAGAVSDSIVADAAGLFDFYGRCAASAASFEKDYHA